MGNIYTHTYINTCMCVCKQAYLTGHICLWLSGKQCAKALLDLVFL